MKDEYQHVQHAEDDVERLQPDGVVLVDRNITEGADLCQLELAHQSRSLLRGDAEESEKWRGRTYTPYECPQRRQEAHW